MLNLPRRHSLETQTATVLQDEIARGTWRDWLPGERSLSQMLQVSRHTLRGALRQLQRDQWITAEMGVGNRVLPRAKDATRRRTPVQDVGLLIPGVVDELVPNHIQWIDELRAMLGERGCRLHLFHGRKYARRNPDAALRRLLREHAHKCWVLLLSGGPVQKWFEKQRIPCVVAGSVYAGVELPFCDRDLLATGRHAAGTLLARGHRRIALLVHKQRLAGDLETEAGFAEGVGASGHDDAELIVATHDSRPTGVLLALKRLMHRERPPTAILVVGVFHYLTVASGLAQLGYRVPQDVSLISRDGEPYLAHLVPEPAHYRVDPRHFAKALLAPVAQLLDGGEITRRAIRIVPEFSKGSSIFPRA